MELGHVGTIYLGDGRSEYLKSLGADPLTLDNFFDQEAK